MLLIDFTKTSNFAEYLWIYAKVHLLLSLSDAILEPEILGNRNINFN